MWANPPSLRMCKAGLFLKRALNSTDGWEEPHNVRGSPFRLTLSSGPSQDLSAKKPLFKLSAILKADIIHDVRLSFLKQPEKGRMTNSPATFCQSSTHTLVTCHRTLTEKQNNSTRSPITTGTRKSTTQCWVSTMLQTLMLHFFNNV